MSSQRADTWRRAQLGSLLSGVVGGGTPSRNIPEFWNGTIPWASVKDFTDGVSKLETTEEYITKEGLASGAANLIRPGVPLICTRMAVGRAAITVKPTAINQDLKALYPSEEISADYLLLVLNHLRTQLENVAVGSTVKGVTLSQLNGLPVDLPSPAEQRKITKIISTVDNLIEKTQALIDKYQSIKQGMMHDLFTRGADENGQLRPSYVEAPYLYQESELGWIPREWDALPLRELYAVPSRSGLYKTSEHYGHGFPMIHMPQMFRGLTVDASDAVLVNVEGVELSRFVLEEGDLLFARRSLTLEGAGRCSLVSSLNGPTTFESSIIRVRISPERVAPSFVNQFLNTEKGYSLRLPLIRQVAVSGVSSSDVASIPVPCPSLYEQQLIMERLSSIHKKVEVEVSYLMKLQETKIGLMQDLLTGKVRVSI